MTVRDAARVKLYVTDDAKSGTFTKNSSTAVAFKFSTFTWGLSSCTIRGRQQCKLRLKTTNSHTRFSANFSQNLTRVLCGSKYRGRGVKRDGRRSE